MDELLARGRGIVKSYGDGDAAVRVLDGAELDVASGELVAVVGRSGSGKSTLLHLLGGLDRPTAGSIDVAGIALDRCSDHELTEFRRRRVGFVFQSFHLLPELTGLENVLLAARLGRGGPPAVARAHELIGALGLNGASRRLPGSLSGGEQQRLAIARALVNEPALVLADEPTGNLDEESGRAVLTLLRDLAAPGRAVVLVTHDTEATKLADRVLHLRAGRLEP